MGSSNSRIGRGKTGAKVGLAFNLVKKGQSRTVYSDAPSAEELGPPDTKRGGPVSLAHASSGLRIWQGCETHVGGISSRNASHRCAAVSRCVSVSPPTKPAPAALYCSSGCNCTGACGCALARGDRSAVAGLLVRVAVGRG